MRKIASKNIYLLGLSSISLISSFFLSTSITYAADVADTPCPDGYVKVSNWNPFNGESLGVRCCKGSESNKGDLEAQNGVCVNTRTAKFVETLPGEVSCQGGTVKNVCDSGLLRHASGCWKTGSKINLTKDYYFLGCSSTVKVTASMGSGSLDKPDVETYEKDLGYCCINGAILSEYANVCICGDPPTTKVNPDNIDCEDASMCGKGNVYKDTENVELKGNDPVTCEVDVNGKKEEGVLTAIGCIPTTSTGLANWALLFGTVLGGIIAVFKIIQGSFMIMTSTGDPDKLQEGKSTITSAVVGLIVILSAVILLSFLGFDLLGLKDLGFNLNINK